ncbi:MAG: hypothetical protein EOO09_08620 [Chitinophagaceae bacterium]|nr:MAG: hypothetical protein EOO09_08620 [Chitinophagaceae bacterium]
MTIRNILLLTTGLFLSGAASAQRDTSRPKSVDITSSYRPTLKPSAKIKFTATPPATDTTRPVLKYDIPNPNLLFAYQPGSLKPLALQVDSVGIFDNSSYIKIGFGSLRTPFLQTGISFGDGNTAGANIYAKHVASQGKRENQDYSSTEVRLSGFYKTAKNIEWSGGIGMKQDRTYKYGYQPETLQFPRDSIRQRFRTVSLRGAARNVNATEFGINYNPSVRIDVFGDQLSNNETNAVLDVPVEKSIGENIIVKLGLNFDLTRLSLDDKQTINNNTWYISPGVLYSNGSVKIHAGIRPSWDNSRFRMFPNILAEAGTYDQRFTLQAGWTGYVRKTSYQYLAGQNPWLWAPTELNNTWIEERFAGFKGTIDDHFTYSAKVGFNRLNNQPLFINDTTAGTDGKSFRVVNASRINVLTFGGELGYTVEEKVSVITRLSWNQFNGIQGQQKAWGMIPLEFNTALRLQVLKDIWIKGDLLAWSGSRYLRQDGSDGKLGGAFDLNAGLEFRVKKNISIWTQFNNVFNKEYMRWNQYPVYGFNFVGGVIFTFDQKTK